MVLYKRLDACSTWQGGEFDPVKPLMEDCVCFRNHTWYHVNFWARSRSKHIPGTRTTPHKIKRFFAELRYKQDHDPIVETCTIIGKNSLS